MAKRSNVTKFGCNNCRYFSAQKNCIKIGFSSRDINDGGTIYTLSGATLKINDISKCPMKELAKVDVIGKVHKMTDVGLVG